MRQVAKKGLLTVVATSGVLAATGGFAYADSGAMGAASNSPGVASGNTVQVPVHIPVNVCGNTVNVVGLLNPAVGNSCVNGSGGDGHHDQRGEKSHDDKGGHETRSGGHDDKGHDESRDEDKGRDDNGYDDEGRDDDNGYEGRGDNGHGDHADGSSAQGVAHSSPGVVSGNVIQVPVHVPVNLCGNGVTVIGALNPTLGNSCANVSGDEHQEHPDDEYPEDHDDERPDKPNNPEHSEESEGPKSPGKPGDDKDYEHEGDYDHEMKPQGDKEVLASTGAEDLGLALAASAGLLLGGGVLYRRSLAGRN